MFLSLVSSAWVSRVVLVLFMLSLGRTARITLTMWRLCSRNPWIRNASTFLSIICTFAPGCRRGITNFKFANISFSVFFQQLLSQKNGSKKLHVLVFGTFLSSSSFLILEVINQLRRRILQNPQLHGTIRDSFFQFAKPPITDDPKSKHKLYLQPWSMTLLQFTM